MVYLTLYKVSDVMDQIIDDFNKLEQFEERQLHISLANSIFVHLDKSKAHAAHSYLEISKILAQVATIQRQLSLPNVRDLPVVRLWLFELEQMKKAADECISLGLKIINSTEIIKPRVFDKLHPCCINQEQRCTDPKEAWTHVYQVYYLHRKTASLISKVDAASPVLRNLYQKINLHLLAMESMEDQMGVKRQPVDSTCLKKKNSLSRTLSKISRGLLGTKSQT